MAQLKYLDKDRTQQKQKGFFVANKNGGPLDVTSWVLYRDNLNLVPNKYVGKRVYVLSEDEEYYLYNDSSWSQLTNSQKVVSDSEDSKFLVKFYKVGDRLSEDDVLADNGSDEKVFVVRPGTNNEPVTISLRVSLILPAKYNNNKSFNIEYPKNGYSNGYDESGVLSSTYRLYYKWYRNSFDSTPIQKGYSEKLEREYDNEKLNHNFSEKICCAVYIEMEKNGELQLVGRNSCHVVSESYDENKDHNRGLVYMSSKVSQYQRGFINSNKNSAGIDTGCMVESRNTLDRIPKYFGKRVYVHEDDSFYIYKFRSDYVDYGKKFASDEERIRHFTSGFDGEWVREDKEPVKFQNFSDIDFRIVPDASNYNQGGGNASVDIDSPPGSYRKMKFSAFLYLKVNNDTHQPVVFTLQDLLDKNYNYNPLTDGYYGHDVSILSLIHI